MEAIEEIGNQEDIKGIVDLSVCEDSRKFERDSKRKSLRLTQPILGSSKTDNRGAEFKFSREDPSLYRTMVTTNELKQAMT
ncbi:hypothetical protein JTB14_003695 [Gonioctena quinquepunctata]|nr:hypothetical protein JTB14_003695 [Gonioctena quinquepunctata]